MNEQLTQLFERFQQMPRAMRWAVYAVAGISVFLLWDTYLEPVYRDWSAAADKIESNNREVRQAKYDATVGRLQQVVKAIGPVELPGSAADAQDEITRLVSELISDYRSVANDSFQIRERGALPRNAVRDLTKPNERIAQLVGDLRFDAHAQDAFSIIAELESHPAIEKINQISLQRQPNQNVTVRMEIEAWVKTRGDVTSRGGRR